MIVQATVLFEPSSCGIVAEQSEPCGSTIYVEDVETVMANTA
jgi:hypothetical protein